MKKLLLSFLALSCIYVSAYAQCPTGRYLLKTFAVDTIKDIQFGSNTATSGTGTTNLIMDVYAPAGDTMSQRPVVIFAHGGTFVAGDRRTNDMIRICHALAARGYVCASIEYRLETALALVSPNANQLMVTEVVRAAQDGKAAVRFFRKDAATTNTYKIDPTQIFFGGTSAGGILAIHLAYMQPTDPLPSTWVTWANSIGGFEGTSGNPGYSSSVKAVVSYAGAIGDTAWLNDLDAPWMDMHSANDATVPDNIGYPLGLTNLPQLMGGRAMNAKSNATGLHHQYWQFTGASHPPFADGSTATWDSTENVTVRFLYNNLTCNPANYSFIINNHSIDEFGKISMYPIPSSNELNIESLNNYSINAVSIFDAQGKEVMNIAGSNSPTSKMSISQLEKGIYFVKIHLNNNPDLVYSTKIIKN
jgi:para-nitrobenzyl esterase